jgi:peptidoglycan biosynthesis protein MviN/MurJ (putative lipid II flippase)
MPKLTKSEWFMFILNLVLTSIILAAIVWALKPQPHNCWNDNLTETTNIQECETKQ